MVYECLRKAANNGLLGITIPKEYGGLGVPFNTLLLSADRMGGYSASFMSAYSAHTGIGVYPILIYGTEK